jgi:hypothetical protein
MYWIILRATLQAYSDRTCAALLDVFVGGEIIDDVMAVVMASW